MTIEIIIRRMAIMALMFAFTTVAMAQATVTLDNIALTVGSGLTVTVGGDFQNQNSATVDNAGTLTVSGNWTNNAANTVFSTNAGKVKMNGTALQTIGGTSGTSFYNLELANTFSDSVRYTLGANTTVMDTLTMTAGNVNMAGYSVTLGSSSAAPGTLAYTSGWFYGGTMTRWFSNTIVADGSVTGLFPIGSFEDYRPLYLSAPTTGPSLGGTVSVAHVSIPWTTAAYFTDINIVIDRIFNSYWATSTGNGLTGGSYNISAGGTGFPAITDYTKLRLVVIGATIGTYGTNGGSNTSPLVNRTGVGVTGLTNYFNIGYPSGYGPLPITLLSFKAIPQKGAVKVFWETASEINTDYFNVERSVDGENFNAINTTPAAGNSSSDKYYSTMDDAPINGWSYYRLREVDYDGTVTYAAPVAVYIDNGLFKIVSTHIQNNKLVVTLFSSTNENCRLEFYDCTGRLLYYQEGNLVNGLDDVMIPLASLHESIGIVTARTASQFVSKKIF